MIFLLLFVVFLKNQPLFNEKLVFEGFFLLLHKLKEKNNCFLSVHVQN
jgi:hypothetical protein